MLSVCPKKDPFCWLLEEFRNQIRCAGRSKHNFPARGNRRLPMQRGDHGASGGAMCFDHTREVRLSICVQRIKGLIE